MILPGISEAMIFLVLGVYEHLTEIPRNFLAGKHIVVGLVTIAVCAAALVATRSGLCRGSVDQTSPA